MIELMTALAGSSTVASTTNSIVETVKTVILAGIAIAAIIYIGKTAFDYWQGKQDASVAKIVVAILVFIALAGATIVVSDVVSLSQKGKGLADTAITKATNAASEIIS